MTFYLRQVLPKALSGVTAGAIVAALIFAPLAFGAVEPWAVSVLAVLAYTALAAALVRAVMMGSVRSLLSPLLVLAALALILLALQYVPWPVGLLESVSPSTVELVRKSAVATGGEVSSSLSPSLHSHATREALIRLSAYVALFAAACGYVRSHKEVTRLAAVLVGTGFAVSLFAIIQNLSGTRNLYWWRELTHGGEPFGPFVSSNQFAAYAGLCLFTGLGLLMARGARAAGSVRRWWENVGRHDARRAHQNFLIGFAVSVMGAALIWSLSRAGIVSMFLAFAGVMVALKAAGFVRSRGFYVGAAVLVILGWGTYLGWEPVVAEFSKLDKVLERPTDDWRWQMSADALRMGSAFPALGTGAGSFLSVYPHYRTLPTYAVARNPHNEYACVFAETGFTGVAILLLAMALLYTRVLRGLVVRRNPYVCGFLAGGFGALLALTLHATENCPMSSQDIAASLAVVAGLLYRGATIESNGNGNVAGGRSSEGRGYHEAGNLNRALAGLLIVGIVWAVACHLALNPLRGQLEFGLIDGAEKQVVPNMNNVLAFVNATEKGIKEHSPRDARLYAKLAHFAWNAAGRISDPAERLRLADRSLALRIAAARLEPLNAEHQFGIAMNYLSFGRSDLAALHAEVACDLVPNDPWIRVYLADGFLAYRQRDLARRYLDRAEQLAAARGIEEAKPEIGAARKRLAAANADKQSSRDNN